MMRHTKREIERNKISDVKTRKEEPDTDRKIDVRKGRWKEILETRSEKGSQVSTL